MSDLLLHTKPIGLLEIFSGSGHQWQWSWSMVGSGGQRYKVVVHRERTNSCSNEGCQNLIVAMKAT